MVTCQLAYNHLIMTLTMSPCQHVDGATAIKTHLFQCGHSPLCKFFGNNVQGCTSQHKKLAGEERFEKQLNLTRYFWGMTEKVEIHQSIWSLNTLTLIEYFFLFFLGLVSALVSLVFHSDPAGPLGHLLSGGGVSPSVLFLFLVAAGFEPMS